MDGWSIFYGVVLILLLAIIVSLVALLHAGLFVELRIRTTVPLPEACPKRVAYKLHRGPYKNAGKAFNELLGIVPKLRLFGIYYDSPNKVPPAQLRYIIGCCLADPPHTQLEGLLKSEGYSLWAFPTCSKAVVTEFPWRSWLSCMVAPRRVYPALIKYFIQQKVVSSAGPIVEVYESDFIRYIAPLVDNEGYFVPEVAREKESKKQL